MLLWFVDRITSCNYFILAQTTTIFNHFSTCLIHCDWPSISKWCRSDGLRRRDMKSVYARSDTRTRLAVGPNNNNNAIQCSPVFEHAVAAAGPGLRTTRTWTRSIKQGLPRYRLMTSLHPARGTAHKLPVCLSVCVCDSIEQARRRRVCCFYLIWRPHPVIRDTASRCLPSNGTVDSGTCPRGTTARYITLWLSQSISAQLF